MTVAMTATGGLLGLVVLVGLLGGLWLRGWVERRQQRPLSTEPETSAATRAAVAVPGEAGRLTTIASWLLRAITTTASASVGFSSRCGVNGGTNT